MSKKALKFDNVEVNNNKKFYSSKQPVALD